MYHQGFKAWVNHYYGKKEVISKGVKAKQVVQGMVRRRFMGEWIKASHRPLKKFESARQISGVVKKLQTKNCFYFWCEFVIRS